MNIINCFRFLWHGKNGSKIKLFMKNIVREKACIVYLNLVAIYVIPVSIINSKY